MTSDDPNRTQLGAPPTVDLNRTMLGSAPTVNATVTIKPVQCPVCKTFNAVGMIFCIECGLIFDRALPGDAFGAPTVQMPTLLDPSGREHILRPGENVLGRAGDISIDDQRVSRRHAQIIVGSMLIEVEDLDSTNGTKLNGEPLTAGMRRPIVTGDKVSLGGYELTLSKPGEATKTVAAMAGKTSAISASPTVETATAWLVSTDQRIPLEQGTHSFGRKAENDIQIVDPYVSGRHGELTVEGQNVYITDLGSSNGTILNDAKLTANHRFEMKEGDALKLGDLEYTLKLREA